MWNHPRAPLTMLVALFACREAVGSTPNHWDDSIDWFARTTDTGYQRLLGSLKGAQAAIQERTAELEEVHTSSHELSIEDKIYMAADMFGERLLNPPIPVLETNQDLLLRNQKMMARVVARLTRDVRAIFDDTRLHYPELSSDLRPPGRCIDPVRAGDPNHDACAEVQGTKMRPAIAKRFTDRAIRQAARDRKEKN